MGHGMTITDDDLRAVVVQCTLLDSSLRYKKGFLNSNAAGDLCAIFSQTACWHAIKSLETRYTEGAKTEGQTHLVYHTTSKR